MSPNRPPPNQWIRCTRPQKCPLCEDTGQWCSVSADGAMAKCRRVSDGAVKESDDGGGMYWIHALKESKPGTSPRHIPREDPRAELADAITLDAAYTALLTVLRLSPSHHDALIKRGLDDDAITQAAYRTLPSSMMDRGAARHALVQAMSPVGGIPRHVPGITPGEILGAPGLLIPVRDPGGKIVAIKIRADQAGDGGKYRWLSSSTLTPPGASPGAPCHVPEHNGISTEIVRITEGPLKADIATARSGILTLGIAGATAARSAIPALNALGAKEVILAWDADCRDPKEGGKNWVAAGLELAAYIFTAEGFIVSIETWPTENGEPKGVDDALVAGAATTVHRGEDALAELMAIIKGAGREPKTGLLIGHQREATRQAEAGAKKQADWTNLLSRNRRGVLNTFGNLCKILRHAPEFVEKFRLNEMSQAVEFDGASLPEERIGQIREAIEDNAEWGGFPPAPNALMDAVRTVAGEKRYHPVRIYLTGLEWDRVQRLSRVAREVLGAKTDLERLQVVRWFVAAARRALRPGTKVDTALILVGKQGRMKSTFFAVLGGAWFADTEIVLGDKDSYGQIHWSWIYELGELDHVTSQRHAGQIKVFISRSADTFRPPYGRITENFQRGCVIVGSTNEDQFLSDPTGSRRFWVVRVGERIDIEKLKEWRDQLWAEATALASDSNQRHWFDAEEDVAREVAAEPHRIRDPWESVIGGWIVRAWPEIKMNARRTWFTTDDIMLKALELKPREMNRSGEMRVGAVMKALGYVSRRVRPPAEDDAYRKASGAVVARPRAWLTLREADVGGWLDADSEVGAAVPGHTGSETLPTGAPLDLGGEWADEDTFAGASDIP